MALKTTTNCQACEDQGDKMNLECSVCGASVCPSCSYDWSGDLMCVRCDPVEHDWQRFLNASSIEKLITWKGK